MNWTLIVSALVVTLSPLPIVAFILVLSTDNGVRNGAAFIAGWISCLVVIVAATLILTDGHPPRPKSTPSNAILAGMLIAGVFLIAYALQQYANISKGSVKPPKTPKWMERFDTMSVWGAAALAILIQPWPFVAAAAASATGLDVHSVGDMLLAVACILLASSTLLGMQAYVVARPEEALARLGRLRLSLELNRRRFIMVLALLLGVALCARGLTALS